jgi:hypothetical protein
VRRKLAEAVDLATRRRGTARCSGCGPLRRR